MMELGAANRKRYTATVPRPAGYAMHRLLLAPLLALPLLLGACSPAPSAAFQGYVEGDYVYVATSQAGRLDKLHVQRGQNVSASAPLFVLDAQPEAALAAQASAQLAAAEATLADLREGKRPPELDVIRAQLREAESELANARSKATRHAELVRDNALPKENADDSATALAVALARRDAVQAQLKVAQLAARDEQIRAQEAQARAQRALLAQAQWQLQQKAVRSTQDARVIDTLYRSGEWVAAGKPVVKLLPPGNILLRFFVPEAELGKLQQGMQLQATQQNGSKPIPVKVTFISPVAEYNPPVIYSNESRHRLVFRVEATPAASEAVSLHPGQPVEVSAP